MKNLSFSSVAFALACALNAQANTTTLHATNTAPTVRVINKTGTVAAPNLANIPGDHVAVPAEVQVVRGRVYDPIDGVIYEQKEVRITPTYVKDIAEPLNTVTRAILNLSEMGWTANQFDRLAADLNNLQTLVLTGHVPSEKFLPGLRKLAGQIKDLTFKWTVNNADERDRALDIIADLVNNGDSLRRVVIADRLILGNGSNASLRGLRDALTHPKHLHYFRLLPSAQKHTAWKHSETKRFGMLLSRADQIRYIDISGNTLGYGPDGKDNIREAFTSFALLKQLKAIDATRNNIGSKPNDVDKVEILVRQLQEMDNVQYIDLSDNELESGANYRKKLELIHQASPTFKKLNIVNMGQLPHGKKFFILSK